MKRTREGLFLHPVTGGWAIAKEELSPKRGAPVTTLMWTHHGNWSNVTGHAIAYPSQQAAVDACRQLHGVEPAPYQADLFELIGDI